MKKLILVFMISLLVVPALILASEDKEGKGLVPLQEEINKSISSFGEVIKGLIPSKKIPSASILASGDVEVIEGEKVSYHVAKYKFDSDVYTVTFVVTRKAVVLVGVGGSFVPNMGKELRAYADAFGKKLSVIITHPHGDNYGNIEYFNDVQVYAQSATANILSEAKDFLYKGALMSVDRTETIGGLEWDFEHVESTEIVENGYLVIPSKKVVFVGDLVYNKTHLYVREYTPKDDVDEIDNWVSVLNTLKASYGDYKYMFVGHGGYVNGTNISTVIDENVEYLRVVQGLVKGTELLSSGAVATSTSEISEELLARYPNWVPSGVYLFLPGALYPEDPGANWF